MDRAKIANDYHEAGYSCAQAVACAFDDVIGLPVEQIAALTGAFGGGLRTGEICGAVSGGAMVLGARWPHSAPEDKQAKAFVAQKVKEFQQRFLEKFPAVRCAGLKELPSRPETSPTALRLGYTKPCAVYIAAAAEILEEMLAEE